jgi:transcriptional regulator with XRE-family HTH domain
VDSRHGGSYYRFENGTRRIYLDKAALLAQALGCTVDDLMASDEPIRRIVEHDVGGTVVSVRPAVPEGWDVD